MALACELSVTVATDCVRFVLAVANAGVDSVEITFRDAGRADIVVADGEETVWRWREGRMVAQVVETITLAPGERFTVEFAWSDAESGSYEAVADLVADPSCRAQATFVVD